MVNLFDFTKKWPINQFAKNNKLFNFIRKKIKSFDFTKNSRFIDLSKNNRLFNFTQNNWSMDIIKKQSINRLTFSPIKKNDQMIKFDVTIKYSRPSELHIYHYQDKRDHISRALDYCLLLDRPFAT